MSRSVDSKRSRMPKVKEMLTGIMDAITKRRIFGRTEKILRRNRKIWTRLAGKRRRAYDRAEIASQVE